MGMRKVIIVALNVLVKLGFYGLWGFFCLVVRSSLLKYVVQVSEKYSLVKRNGRNRRSILSCRVLRLGGEKQKQESCFFYKAAQH